MKTEEVCFGISNIWPPAERLSPQAASPGSVLKETGSQTDPDHSVHYVLINKTLKVLREFFYCKVYKVSILF